MSVALVLFVLASGEHVRRSVDPLWLSNDARQQVWPFLRFHDPEVFRDDPVADYLLSCLPLGYQAVYRVTAPVVDPRVTSRIIPYLTFGALLAGVWMTCRAISGRLAAWLGVLTVIAAGAPLERMSGGLPRSFAMALVALGAAGMVCRRPRWLAAAAVAGAAFYPVIGVLLGISLAVYALVWPGLKPTDGGARNRVAAVRLTAITGLACLAMGALPSLGSARYGERVGLDQHDVYP